MNYFSGKVINNAIIDASEETDKNNIITLKPYEADSAEWFVKCPKCKNQIGLSFKYGTKCQ